MSELRPDRASARRGPSPVRCGAWLSCDEPIVVADADEPPVERWPRIEGDLSAIERLNDAYRRITDELGKVIVGQQQVIEELLIAMFARGHCLLIGVPGLAKTLMIRTLADAPEPELQPHPVHARPDAVGHHRHRGDPGRQGRPASGRFKFLHGAGLRQHPPGRRNQPHAAQDPGRPARSDAGAPGHRRRARSTACPTRSSCWPRRTRSSRKAPIRCPRPSSTASCSTSSSTIPRRKKNSRSCVDDDRRTSRRIERVLSADDILELQDIVRKVPVADHVHPLRPEVHPADAQGQGRGARLHSATT